MPHEPTAACQREHCHIHNEDEPVPEAGGYLICGECGHLYGTADELEAAYVACGLTPRPADDITFCPHCSHDF